LKSIDIIGFGLAALALMTDMMGESSPAVRRGSAQISDPVLDIIKATGHAEGGFDAVNGNVGSHEGVSFGILQWTQGSGNLGIVLQAMQATSPSIFAQILGPSWAAVLKVAVDSKDKNVQRTVDGKKLWEEPWISKFRLLGQNATMQLGQISAARNGVFMREALRGAEKLGLEPTMHVVGVLFDRAVQNGHNGLKGAVEDVSERLAQQDTGEADTGADLDEDDVLRMVIQRLARPFRRSTAPAPEDDPKGRWRQVGREWHKFHGTGVDLYTDTIRRGELTLANGALRRDVRVES